MHIVHQPNLVVCRTESTWDAFISAEQKHWYVNHESHIPRRLALSAVAAVLQMLVLWTVWNTFSDFRPLGIEKQCLVSIQILYIWLLRLCAVIRNGLLSTDWFGARRGSTAAGDVHVHSSYSAKINTMTPTVLHLLRNFAFQSPAWRLW